MSSKSRLNRLGLLLALAMVQPAHAQLLRTDLERPLREEEAQQAEALRKKAEAEARQQAEARRRAEAAQQRAIAARQREEAARQQAAAEAAERKRKEEFEAAMVPSLRRKVGGIQEIEGLADKGNRFAMLILASVYKHGLYGREKDTLREEYWSRESLEASQWVSQEAENGNELAVLWRVCEILLDGDSNGRALSLLQEVAGRSSEAMNIIGWMYAKGEGVQRDYAKALYWFGLSANAGNLDAMNNIGVMHGEGMGVSVDWNKSIEWLRRGVEGGASMRNIGVFYEKRGYKGRDEWLRNSAASGDVVAAHDLCYIYNSESEANLKASWCRKAADSGSAMSMFNLGILYDSKRPGYYGIKDDALAVHWYTLSASSSKNSLYLVDFGVLYFRGNEFFGDSYYYYYQKRNYGYSGVNAALALCYRKFEVVSSFLWCLRAAEAGNMYAMDVVGVRYEKGEGVAKNEAEAVSWYQRAARAGNTNAQNNLRRRGLGW